MLMALRRLTCEEANDRLRWLEAGAGQTLASRVRLGGGITEELEIIGTTVRLLANHFRTDHDHLGVPQMKCTASSQQRSWERLAWVNGEGLCPDCGAEVEVWVRGTDLCPTAKAKAHDAPKGVTPTPYGIDGKAGRAMTKPACVRCTHPHEAHRHYRAGSDCSWCFTCHAYEANRSWLTRILDRFR
jgi:hypothetical protein